MTKTWSQASHRGSRVPWSVEHSFANSAIPTSCQLCAFCPATACDTASGYSGMSKLSCSSASTGSKRSLRAPTLLSHTSYSGRLAALTTRCLYLPDTSPGCVLGSLQQGLPACMPQAANRGPAEVALPRPACYICPLPTLWHHCSLRLPCRRVTSRCRGGSHSLLMPTKSVWQSVLTVFKAGLTVAM